MKKDPVIVLDLKPYCQNGCEDLKPEVTSYYANNIIYGQYIKCQNREHCERIAKLIRGFYEHKSEEE